MTLPRGRVPTTLASDLPATLWIPPKLLHLQHRYEGDLAATTDLGEVEIPTGGLPPPDTARAMSQENVEIIRRGYEHFRVNNDWEAFPPATPAGWLSGSGIECVGARQRLARDRGGRAQRLQYPLGDCLAGEPDLLAQ
jgi:hypothetical protein